MIYIIDVYHMKGVKRGDGEEEGIYLLAKDLAYNVALDQTEQLTKGIHGLAKKEMYAVNQDINILDNKLEKDICKSASKNDQEGRETAGKCGIGKSNSTSTKTGLNALWEPHAESGNNHGGGYGKTSTDKMGDIHRRQYLQT